MNVRPSVAALVLFLVPLAAQPVRADPIPAGALAPLDRLVAGINADDATQVASAYSVEPTIVDEFAPFQWQGVDSAKHWARDFHAFAVANGISQVKVARLRPTYFHRKGNFAYLCVPMNFSYVAGGKPESERGAFVLSLYQMEGLGWKIRASSWYLINDSTDPPIGAGLK